MTVHPGRQPSAAPPSKSPQATKYRHTHYHAAPCGCRPAAGQLQAGCPDGNHLPDGLAEAADALLDGVLVQASKRGAKKGARLLS
eukprot:354423-Chlamydomonas_euryale.AAC.15